MSLALSKTAGGSGGAASENICNLFPHLDLERVSPALKMTQKNNINRNTFILENWQFNNKLDTPLCLKGYFHNLTKI